MTGFKIGDKVNVGNQNSVREIVGIHGECVWLKWHDSANASYGTFAISSITKANPIPLPTPPEGREVEAEKRESEHA